MMTFMITQHWLWHFIRHPSKNWRFSYHFVPNLLKHMCASIIFSILRHKDTLYELFFTGYFTHLKNEIRAKALHRCYKFTQRHILQRFHTPSSTEYFMSEKQHCIHLTTYWTWQLTCIKVINACCTNVSCTKTECNLHGLGLRPGCAE